MAKGWERSAKQTFRKESVSFKGRFSRGLWLKGTPRT